MSRGPRTPYRPNPTYSDDGERREQIPDAAPGRRRKPAARSDGGGEEHIDGVDERRRQNDSPAISGSMLGRIILPPLSRRRPRRPVRAGAKWHHPSIGGDPGAGSPLIGGGRNGRSNSGNSKS